MNGHGCIVNFFFFLMLSAIILLQILSVTRLDRLREHLKSSFRNVEKCRLCIVEVMLLRSE
jgi:hypothetical protein